MPKFLYKGETATGSEVTETVEAADRFGVYEIARTKGHTVTSVEAVSGFSPKNWINLEKINYHLSRVKADELVMMTHNLSAMLKAGLPLSKSLSVIERQSTNPRLSGVMKKIRERVSTGDPFHVALEEFPKTFSTLYIAMVRAGEESGGLAEALETISTQLERASNLRKKIKGAMMYPAIVLGVMVIIGVLMMIYVMPTMTDTFLRLGIELPLTTRILIGTSTFLTEHGIVALAITVSAIGALMGLSRTTQGKSGIHWALYHLPVIGELVKQTNAAYTARTLSSLLSSGVDMINAITITRDVIQNVHFKKVLEKAAKEVEKGTALSESFIESEKLYPILVGEMISVGEETGQISGMMSELAVFYENEVERKTKDLSTIIEPILMVVIGAGVGFFALAMIAPIYSISDSIE